MALTESQIKDTIRTYAEEAREAIEDEAISKRRTPAMQEAYQGVLLEDIAAYDYAAGHADYREIAPQVAKLFGMDRAAATSDAGFHRACREWALATAELRRYYLRLLQGKPVEHVGTKEPIAPPTGKPSGKLISSMLEPFIEDRVKSRGIKQNTEENYRQHVRAFTDIAGDKAVDSYTHKDACRFRDDLLTLPKNRNKSRHYRGFSVSTLLAMDIPAEERLSGRTVLEHLTSLKAMFGWLTACREIEHNPFTTVSVPHESQSYTIYTADDLNLIFSSELYQPESAYANKRDTTAGQWWLPLLALYTGARPSELVQLRLSDIRQIGEHVVRVLPHFHGHFKEAHNGQKECLCR
ncbi:hypothetical protein Q6D67_17655, partial [Haliea sp. E1-2-M8]|uniref:hypothetical protein n=1 Tax=Haliea sp. E1-2-M8 TaxID=3064706 RepID=UPI002722DFFA